MRTHGMVGLVASDQGLAAGTLACRFGDDIFLLSPLMILDMTHLV